MELKIKEILSILFIIVVILIFWMRERKKIKL